MSNGDYREFVNSAEGQSLLLELIERIETNFTECHLGRPAACSEYGVEYGPCRGFSWGPASPDGLMTCDPATSIRGIFIHCIEPGILQLRSEGDVLVWRRKPELVASDDLDGPPQRIKFSFRAHAIPYETYLKTLPPRVGVNPNAGPWSGEAPGEADDIAACRAADKYLERPDFPEMHEIGWAIKQMRNGDNVRRVGWDTMDTWLKIVPSWDDESASTSTYLTEEPFVARKLGTGGIIPWSPSHTDLLATDWEIVT